EVTVGRFRQFLTGYNAWRSAGNPSSGAGGNGMTGTGWDTAWDASLPADVDAVKGELYANAVAFPTWGAGDGAVPINYVDWYEAFAFCVWDGGRLPTSVEWEYAASNRFQTQYPWGASAPTTMLAVYGYCGQGESTDCFRFDIPEV